MMKNPVVQVVGVFVCILVLGINLVPYANAGGKQEIEEIRYSIATGSEESSSYVLGNTIISLLNQELKGEHIIFSSVESSGEIENISILKGNRSDFAISIGSYAQQAYQGKGVFSTEAYGAMRLVAGLMPSLIQFVFSDYYDINIRTLDDIDGRKYNIGANGSAAELDTLFILQKLASLPPGTYFDWHLNDINALGALQNDEIIGMTINGIVPTPILASIFGTTTRVQLYNFSQKEYHTLKKLDDSLGYYTIPQSAYLELPSEIKTLGRKIVLLANETVGVEGVYKVLKTIFTYTEELNELNQAGVPLSIENSLENVPAMRMHFGAIEFYEEFGIDVNLYK